MARTANKETHLVEDVELPVVELLAAQNQVAVLDAEHETRVRAVAVQLGYQLPADCTSADLIQRDIAANMRRSVEACLEIGRGLQVLKVACGHGEFGNRLDVLGIETHVASRFMSASRKFANLPSTANLTKAIGNQTKLFEMLVLDDEQIEELELTGQTGELTLDAVATMSVKELRGALREAKEDAKAKDRVLADKNAKIDDLATQLAKKPKVVVIDPDEQVGSLRKEVAAAAYRVEAEMRANLRAAFTSLAEHAEETGADHRGFQVALVRQLEQLLADIRAEFQLQDDDAAEDFGWLKQAGVADPVRADSPADAEA